MSGTNYTGTPDGREGWAQNFVRAGYAVYVVDQVGKGRSAYFPVTGPQAATDMANNQSRYVAQKNSDSGRRRISIRNGRATAHSMIRRCNSPSLRSFPRSRIFTASKNSTLPASLR